MGMSLLCRVSLAIAAVLIVADQITKWIILERVMVPPRIIPVTDFFNLVLVWNRGVSFGLFSDGDPSQRWILIGVALAVTTALTVWLWRADRWPVALALGLVIGGALGNVIDRLRFGAVADFLDFHVAGFHWPAFNLADSAITVGVVLLVLDSLFGSRAGRRVVTQEEPEP